VRGKRVLLIIGIAFPTFFSCVRRITPLIREAAPILVVEGEIGTYPPPYTVKLSFTGANLNASSTIDSNQHYINDAVVVIRDDAGDSTVLSLATSGNYETTDTNFVGIAGRTYRLVIHLSDGRTYVSNGERITPVVPIDSITAILDSTVITDVRPTQFIVSVNSRDPATQGNYYRWTASGYIPRKSYGYNFTTGLPCYEPFNCYYKAYCEQFSMNTQINVLSDQFVNGRKITAPVFYSPIFWFGIHYVQVNQFSISQEMYAFWEKYLQQTNLTGGILDPLPQSLVGNIFNAADSNDLAVGYFEASDMTSKKAIIIDYDLQQYLLEVYGGQFIKPGDCTLVYPNSLPDEAQPAAWSDVTDTLKFQ